LHWQSSEERLARTAAFGSAAAVTEDEFEYQLASGRRQSIRSTTRSDQPSQSPNQNASWNQQRQHALRSKTKRSGRRPPVTEAECQLALPTTTLLPIDDEARSSTRVSPSPFSFSRDSLIWLTVDCIIRLSTLFLDVTCHLPKNFVKRLDEFLIVG
jgi:hypothetical protein